MVRRIKGTRDLVERVETGVVQFGDDWPGIFIRGDEALGLANDLTSLVPTTPHARAFLDRLAAKLRECRKD